MSSSTQATPSTSLNTCSDISTSVSRTSPPLLSPHATKIKNNIDSPLTIDENNLNNIDSEDDNAYLYVPQNETITNYLAKERETWNSEEAWWEEKFQTLQLSGDNITHTEVMVKWEENLLPTILDLEALGGCTWPVRADLYNGPVPGGRKAFRKSIIRKVCVIRAWSREDRACFSKDRARLVRSIFNNKVDPNARNYCRLLALLNRDVQMIDFSDAEDLIGRGDSVKRQFHLGHLLRWLKDLSGLDVGGWNGVSDSEYSGSD